MNVYYDKDCDLSIIQGKKVAIIGYGSQGHAHALNLQDSDVDVTVGLRANSGSWKKAENAGLKVAEVEEAVKAADVIMILTPDEFQKELYNDVIEPNIKEGRYIGLSLMVLRFIITKLYHVAILMSSWLHQKHQVIPFAQSLLKAAVSQILIAIYQDASGQAKQLALSYAAGVGGGRSGIIETTFKDETETDSIW